MPLHHIALGTSDVAALAGFYERVFGLSVLAKHEHDDGSLRSIWLDLDPGILMVERSNASPRHVEGIGAGPFLLAFPISSLERAEAQLARWGLEPESRTAHTIYFRDLDGNRVAWSTYPRPS